MAIRTKNPITPTQRFRVEVYDDGLSKKRPEKRLTKIKRRTGGRNCYGRVTSRRRGGGHKKLYRQIDFKRNRLDEVMTVEAIEYDPNRTSHIALVTFDDGEKRYIPAADKVKAGDKLISASEQAAFTPGNSMPLRNMPPSVSIHCIELVPGRGAKMVRSAGNAATLIAIDGDRALLRMPSGEQRYVHADCRATIGRVGNVDHGKEVVGKAGRNRWKGKRPRVRGVAMNPVDHPMGGGEGRTSGGGHPVSPWGQLSKGYPTRRKRKASERQILVRRDGRRVKQ